VVQLHMDFCPSVIVRQRMGTEDEFAFGVRGREFCLQRILHEVTLRQGQMGRNEALAFAENPIGDKVGVKGLAPVGGEVEIPFFHVKGGHGWPPWRRVVV